MQFIPEHQGYISEPVMLEIYFTLQRGCSFDQDAQKYLGMQKP